ncbi:MAG: glycosyltransferase family 39 protein [Chloroflexi bacterium]|nr:glycosyltransferase family 39 protein [Chloroflexota bacterium]
MHNDEAQEAGLQAQQILAGQPVTAFRDATVGLGTMQWPLMVQDYIGSLNVLTAIPFFAVLGANVFALRLMAVSIGLATIVLTYGFAVETFGERPAAVAAILLAVQPSFLFWSRQGVFVTSIAAALAMAALWAGAAWARRSGWWRLALAGLCAGLGVYAKLSFLWVIGGAVGAAIVLALLEIAIPASRSTLHASRATGHAARVTLHVSLTPVLTFLLPFILGLAPLVIYNLKTGGTLASVGGNLTTSFYGVDNLHLAQNLAARWDELRAVLAGRDHLWYLGGSHGNPATEWALALAIGVIIFRALARRPASRLPLGAVLLTLFAFLQTIFTVSGLFPTHFALLVPFFPLIIALGVDGFIAEDTDKTDGTNVSRATSNPNKSVQSVHKTILLLLAITGLAARDVWVDVSYHRDLARTGGLNAHSDSVYALAKFLDSQPNTRPVVALDWGFAPSVRFLTHGRVSPNEIFGYSWEPDPGFEDRLATALADPNTLFILHWPQETIFPRREAFEASLAGRGLKVVTVETFSRRDGAPIFDMVRVEKSSP